MRLITLGLGAALGYFLGSAEGRKNLEKMTTNAQKVWNDPKTQEKVEKVQESAQQKLAEVKDSEQVQKATAKVESAVKSDSTGQGDKGQGDKGQARGKASGDKAATTGTTATTGTDPDMGGDPAAATGGKGPQTR